MLLRPSAVFSFVSELDGEALCLSCYDILAVLKECNKLLDYQTKHCHHTPNGGK